MGNPRGVARDFNVLEARRMDALALLRKGLNNSKIGRLLGVVNQTVSRWRKEYHRGGKKALAQAGRAGLSLADHSGRCPISYLRAADLRQTGVVSMSPGNM